MPENPIKNDFYAGWLTAEERRRLKKAGGDAQAEIAALRTFAGRITRRLSTKEPEEYSDEDLKCLNTLVRLTVAIATLLRTNVTVTGRDSNVEKSIEEAIQGMEEQWSLA
jgi:hypothetical protein